MTVRLEQLLCFPLGQKGTLIDERCVCCFNDFVRNFVGHCCGDGMIVWYLPLSLMGMSV